MKELKVAKKEYGIAARPFLWVNWYVIHFKISSLYVGSGQQFNKIENSNQYALNPIQ